MIIKKGKRRRRRIGSLKESTRRSIRRRKRRTKLRSIEAARVAGLERLAAVWGVDMIQRAVGCEAEEKLLAQAHEHETLSTSTHKHDEQ